MPIHRYLTLPERFHLGYHKQETSGCWIWIRSKDKDGYGYIKRDGKTAKAHRVAYELYVGSIGNFCVLHTCDNPSCVNTEHLWLGTKADNMIDKQRKGRASNKGGNKNQWGINNPNYKTGEHCK